MESTYYKEYLEEDNKRKYFKSNSDQRKHIQAVHHKAKYPCNRCEY